MSDVVVAAHTLRNYSRLTTLLPGYCRGPIG